MASSQDNNERLSSLSNQQRMYFDLDTSMMRAHREETDEADEKAISTARILVADADVPLYVRARACMVLGCSEEEDFLVWAEEGVRVAELIVQVVEENVTELETLLKNFKEVLDEAKAAKEEMEAEVSPETKSAVSVAGEEEQGSDGKSPEHVGEAGEKEDGHNGA